MASQAQQDNTNPANLYKNPSNGVTYNIWTGAVVSGGQPQTTQQSQTQTAPATSSNSSQANIYSTVDGHKLAPGETYVDSSGRTVTQGTPQGTYGNVSSTGAITAPDAATNKYNTATGQPNSNYNLASNLPSTGNPAMDAAQNATGAAITQLYATGQIPTSLALTPANVAQILSIAQSQTAPQTQQLIQNEISNLNSNIQNYGNQFSNQEAEAIQSYGTNLAQTQQAAGQSGTSFSGQNNLNQNMLALSTNRTLSGLSSQASTDIGNALRTSAGNVGNQYTNQFNLPSLNSASVGVGGGQRGSVNNTGALNYNYNPSLYTVGSIPSQQATTAQNLANTYTQQYGTLAGNPSNSTRSVSDLLGQVPGLNGNTF